MTPPNPSLVQAEAECLSTAVTRDSHALGSQSCRVPRLPKFLSVQGYWGPNSLGLRAGEQSAILHEPRTGETRKGVPVIEPVHRAQY